jgi:2'-5' RNA ligase
MSELGRVEGREHLRLFIGLPLPAAVAAQLAAWQAAELRGRVVPVEHLHITLAFLGSRPRNELRAIAQVLRAACADASIRALRISSYRETRSVGMLVLDDEDGGATAFAEDIHARLERRALYRREARRWLPHVTVLRFRERPRLQPPLPELGAFAPSEAAVYHSVLRPAGAQYVILEAVALGG